MRDQAMRLRELFAPSPPAPSQRTHAVAIASGKGGVGKTTISVNLSLALGDLGHTVLLWDADFSLANANVLLNLQVSKTVRELIDGSATLEEVLLSVTDKVWLLPGASGIAELARMDGHAFTTIRTRLTAMEERFAFILADAAAGIGSDVLSVCMAAHELLLVTTPEPTALTDAYGLLKALARQGFNQPIHIVLNMVNSPSECEAGERLCQVVKRFLGMTAQVIATVPFSLWVHEAVLRQIPLLHLAPSCPTAKGVRELARRLASRSPGDDRSANGRPSFLQRLLSFLRSE